MHILDGRQVEILKHKIDYLLTQLEDLKARAAIEYHAPAMGEEWRNSLMEAIKAHEERIEQLQAVLPCDGLLEFGADVYRAVIQHFPYISRKTRLESALQVPSFYWRPPVEPLYLPFSAAAPPVYEAIEINLTRFTNGKNTYAFYHLVSHDILFYWRPEA